MLIIFSKWNREFKQIILIKLFESILIEIVYYSISLNMDF